MTGKIIDFRFKLFLSLGLLVFLATQRAHGDEQEKLPIPRFVSLKHGEINLRVGPGRRYPVTWVYKRKQLPVEIIAEFDIWRKVQDWEGTTGWVIRQAVSGTRTFIVTGATRTLRADPADSAAAVALVEAGVIGKIHECPARALDWCDLDINGKRGWLKRNEIWGVYPWEIIQ